MPFPMTKAMRPVGTALNEAIGDFPRGPFNYGLYFNKWMYIENGDLSLGETGKKPWACPGADESKLVNKMEKIRDFNPLLDNFEISIALFNGLPNYRRNRAVVQHKGGNKKFKEELGDVPIQGAWKRDDVKRLLTARHKALNAIAASFSDVGYEYTQIEAELLSPLVIGLGNEHPTEKGFRFEWTLGIPIIPASGIKGVVRLAWLVDRLNEKPDVQARQFWEEVSGRWRHTVKPAQSIMPKEAQQIFGCGAIARPEQKQMRGRVIFLDALPATLPRLKAEIMNCHYPKYLNRQPGDREFRGPTEDQNPNPQKFWALDALDDREEALKFIFRLLVHRSIADDAHRKQPLLDAITKALKQYGLGAKTAIGHGRFRPVGGVSTTLQGSMTGPESVDSSPRRKHTPPIDPKAARQAEIAQFQRSLPSAADLPSQIDAIIAAIRVKTDPEIRKQCCQALIGLAQKDIKKFKRALKDDKPWTKKLMDLCNELKVE